MTLLAACAFLVLLFAPAQASAWGPITHLAHGSGVLENLTILGISLQRLLRRHRLEYLYGCIGADITQAKKYTRAQQAHCHSWRVGWSLVERADNDAQRAFAYGYLTHLAGDVYSHNHYVPTQLIVSFRARTLRHTYWEARFDAQQQAAYRLIVRELRGHRFPECDALVRDVVSRTLFSFRTDKRIFRGFIAIHDLDQWHRIMRRLSAGSRYPLPMEVVERYNAACHGSIVDLLQRGKHSVCQGADPTGLRAIALAKEVRRSLKALNRQGRVTPKLQEEIDALDERLDLEPATGDVPLCVAH
ncbi:MAG TPA: zinc dependent phospholipase C family protein [Candidatus Margulisiibacteriota bacterium]|nr:zinc dependent phospholipase C family protein [Candidatus Margulisiibacteriota bacterium]